MAGITFNPEISIGDVLTVITIVFSVVALIASWRSDQILKQKEYADRIRRGAAIIVAKLQRYSDLSLSFLDELQPVITDADILLVKSQDPVTTRDAFWKTAVDIRAHQFRSISDEQIEIAYVDLYGYDPRIQSVFDETYLRLKHIDHSIYSYTIMLTQSAIIDAQKKPYVSASLGNDLRRITALLSKEGDKIMSQVIAHFSQEMIRLIQHSDKQIVRKGTKVLSVRELYPITLEKFISDFDAGLERAFNANH